MIRKTIIVGLTLATLGWGWLWILAASAEGHELHDVVRWELFDLEVSYASGYAILARHLPEPPAYEIIEHADGRITEITRTPGSEQRFTYDPANGRYGGPVDMSFGHVVSCDDALEVRLVLRPPDLLDVRVSEHLQEITVVPWLPFLLCALYPTWTVARGHVRRRHRRKRGLCLRCGYDLTGNVSGVCSECGVPLRPGPRERSIQ